MSMEEFNRKILVSDLYDEINEKKIDMDKWDEFIREKLSILLFIIRV